MTDNWETKLEEMTKPEGHKTIGKEDALERARISGVMMQLFQKYIQDLRKAENSMVGKVTASMRGESLTLHFHNNSLGIQYDSNDNKILILRDGIQVDEVVYHFHLKMITSQAMQNRAISKPNDYLGQDYILKFASLVTGK